MSTWSSWLAGAGRTRWQRWRPFLKKLFYGINFTPFIQEAERRARAARV